jgi:integrase
MEEIPVFHTFRKPKVLKNGKKIYKWYYYYYSNSGKKVQKRCTACQNRSEAENFIRSIPIPPDLAGAAALSPIQDVKIKDIAEKMFIAGSGHIERRKQLGKSVEIETMIDGRRFIRKIIEQWGDRKLESIEADEVSSLLFETKRSGSWKNRYLQIFGEVYEEAAWFKVKAVKPPFPTFARHSKKADIFTTAELNKIFQLQNFPDVVYYALFLVSLSGGLRLGEARAIRAKQIIFDKKVLIIDGFCKRDGRRTVYNKAGTVDEPKLRAVFLPSKTVKVLKDHIKKNKIQPEDFIFKKDGRPLRMEWAEIVFYKALQNVGLIPRERPKIADKTEPELKIKGRKKQDKRRIAPLDGRKLVPHSLRYTYVSRMRRELSAETLQKMTGHNSIEMVDYYTRPVLDDFLSALPGAEQATEKLFT